jgi:hypothetical protein
VTDPATASGNPYAATTLEMSPAPPRFSEPAPRWLRPLLTLMVLFLAVGTIAAWVHVESILVSGPILFLVGVFLAVWTRRQRNIPIRMVACGALAFPVFCVLLINFYGWGPRDAQRPISVLCLAFSLLMPLLIRRALRRLPSRASEGGLGDAFPLPSSESEHSVTADGSTATF